MMFKGDAPYGGHTYPISAVPLSSSAARREHHEVDIVPERAPQGPLVARGLEPTCRLVGRAGLLALGRQHQHQAIAGDSPRAAERRVVLRALAARLHAQL